MSKLTDEWGFFTPMPEVVIEAWPQLGTDAIAMFLYLRFKTNKKRGVAWPSFKEINNSTGLSFRRISRGLKTLENNGLLYRKKRFSLPVEYRLVRPPDIGVSSPLTVAGLEEKERLSPLTVTGQSSHSDNTVLSQWQTTQDSVKQDVVKKTELKDSPSLSQDNWVKALMVINLDYYQGRNRQFERDWDGTGYVGRQDGKFTVACRDDDQRLWLQDHGKKIAENVLVGVLGERVEIEFVVEI